jgi:hypothetical protein
MIDILMIIDEVKAFGIWWLWMRLMAMATRSNVFDQLVSSQESGSFR